MVGARPAVPRPVPQGGCGRAAAIDYDEVVLDWMDRYVRDDARATPVEGARYFVMGDNRWKTADTWPPQGRASVFYLSPAGQKSTRGSLTAAPLQGTQPPFPAIPFLYNHVPVFVSFIFPT